MTSKADPKREVREFYDQVGWQEVSDGLYQNARYEDLRPVSREYIHNCHLRVKKHLHPTGRLLLDAGSGPIQYPEYLTFSENYQFRVCADISHVALLEARKRIGEHGLFVVADVANLPFKSDVFDGLVSLHTIHHLPEKEHFTAYQGLYRVMAPGTKGVVVNGWHKPPLTRFFKPLIKLATQVRGRFRRLTGKPPLFEKKLDDNQDLTKPTGTFVKKNNVHWLRNEIGSEIPIQIFVWRSVNVKFLRALIHKELAGRFLLKLLYSIEEAFPRWFGENGQYPLVVITKTSSEVAGD